MKKTLIILGIVVFVVAAVLVAGPFFVLDEGEQAVVVRFGKIVRTHTEAGMKLRTPFVDIVNKYPKKILAWGTVKQRIPPRKTSSSGWTPPPAGG